MPIEYKHHTGLKNFFHCTKHLRLKIRLRELKYELHYAWKRAWLGYDDLDIIEMHVNFCTRMITILERFKQVRTGCFNVPIQSEHYQFLGEEDENTGYRYFNGDDTNMIIDMMIWHLKMMDKDFAADIVKENSQLHFYRTCRDRTNKLRLYNNDNNNGNVNKPIKPSIASIQSQNKECFMKLFSMFFYQLWD